MEQSFIPFILYAASTVLFSVLGVLFWLDYARRGTLESDHRQDATR